jgi:hypothetical protein
MARTRIGDSRSRNASNSECCRARLRQLRLAHTAVRIRLENPALLPELAASLVSRLDAVVVKLNERDLEVNLLGSHETSQMRVELEQRLNVWRLGHPFALVSIVDDDEPGAA